MHGPREFCSTALFAGQWCLNKGQFKVVYVAPTKALIQERVNDWSQRFGHLQLSIVECTGDSAESMDLTQADVIATTPCVTATSLLMRARQEISPPWMFQCRQLFLKCREKLDALSRRCFDTGSMRFVSDVALLLIDEVHVVSETRGPTLEAGVVCRLQSLGSMPQMHGTNLHSLRIVAASATIPNVYDIARWIKAPEEGCKVFGEEMRPVTIKTVVKAFPRNAGKNDFLFEKNLNQKVFPILQEFWQQKPVIIFCSSRKGAMRHCVYHCVWGFCGCKTCAVTVARMACSHSGTVECCNKINEASRQQRLQTASYFVRNAEQQARLRDAAATVQDKALADFITQGLAWHHAAMSQEDRATVEKLFLSRDLMCIAATATLAQVSCLLLWVSTANDDQQIWRANVMNWVRQEAAGSELSLSCAGSELAGASGHHQGHTAILLGWRQRAIKLSRVRARRVPTDDWKSRCAHQDSHAKH